MAGSGRAAESHGEAGASKILCPEDIQHEMLVLDESRIKERERKRFFAYSAKQVQYTM